MQVPGELIVHGTALADVFHAAQGRDRLANDLLWILIGCCTCRESREASARQNPDRSPPHAPAPRLPRSTLRISGSPLSSLRSFWLSTLVSSVYSLYPRERAAARGNV